MLCCGLDIVSVCNDDNHSVGYGILVESIIRNEALVSRKHHSNCLLSKAVSLIVLSDRLQVIAVQACINSSLSIASSRILISRCIR